MKKVIIGFVVGVIFATAGSVIAAPAIEKITASVRSDYKVELDGKKVELKNSPLAYNGSSYLPVKEVAGLIGKDVTFKDGVIKINTPDDTSELTQEEYENKLYALNNLKKGYINGIEMNKEAIRRADEGQFKPTETEYKEYVDGLVEYEKLLTNIEHEIADLKAKYPELIESSK